MSLGVDLNGTAPANCRTFRGLYWIALYQLDLHTQSRLDDCGDPGYVVSEKLIHPLHPVTNETCALKEQLEDMNITHGSSSA